MSENVETQPKANSGEIKDLNDLARNLAPKLVELLGQNQSGRTVKNIDGSAVFVPGSAAKPTVFDPGKVADDLHLWWESGAGDKYVMEHLDGGGSSSWHEHGKQMLLDEFGKRYLAVKKRQGEEISEAADVLLYVRHNRVVDLVLDALPGYKGGIHESRGKRILVRTSPKLVSPIKGEWPTIAPLLQGTLAPSGGSDQTRYFHGLMKVAVESLYAGPGNFRALQCCIFAGPHNSGKSRIQHWIITPLLGGRSADPGPYLFGQTDFNGEWLEGEHLLMEDPASSTATKDRVLFGERLKQTIVNDRKRFHMKRQTAQNLEPFHLLSISVNDDPDKIRVLPLLTPDMKYKVQLFLVARQEMPMPTSTLAERCAFREKVASELPAYLYWLLNDFELPEDLRDNRFGVKSWRHPALSKALFDDTPAAELLQIIDAASWEEGSLWRLGDYCKKQGIFVAGALDLERLLLSSTVTREAERLLRHHKLERLLSRLKEDEPDRVAHTRTAQKKLWWISEPSK